MSESPSTTAEPDPLARRHARQLLVIHSAALFTDPLGVIVGIHRFPGLNPERLKTAQPANEGHCSAMAQELAKRLRVWFEPHQQALQVFLAKHALTDFEYPQER